MRIQYYHFEATIEWMDLDIDHQKFPLVMREIELDSMYLLMEVHNTIN